MKTWLFILLLAAAGARAADRPENLVQWREGLASSAQPGAAWLGTIGDQKYENCVHLRIVTAAGKTEDTWDAPKMGTVKSESVMPNGVRIVLTLKEYQPGK